MNKKEFYERMRDILENRLGSDFRCETSTMLKGGRVKQILIIRKKDETVCPIIHLEEYYARYLQGYHVDAIADELIPVCKSNQPKVQELLPEMGNHLALKNLIIKVINKEKYREYLAHTPHVPLKGLDLAGIFFLVLRLDDEGMAGVTVTQGILKSFEKTTEELLTIALNNMEQFFPMAVKNMWDVIGNMIGMEGMEVFSKELGYMPHLPLYILSDVRTGLIGASGFFMRKVIHEFAVEKDCNMVIFPSSIHELLLFPESEKTMRKEDLYEMVQAVNQTSVSDEDFLSDHVYYYDRTTKEITIY